MDGSLRYDHPNQRNWAALFCSANYHAQVAYPAFESCLEKISPNCDHSQLRILSSWMDIYIFKGAMSRGFCCFSSILCLNDYLVPLLIHKMLL